jgi:hypothetical protein
VTKAETNMLERATADRAGVLQNIRAPRDRRVAAYLHAEGYGIWFPAEDQFRLLPEVAKTLRRRAARKEEARASKEKK